MAVPVITNKSHGNASATSLTISHVSDGHPLYLLVTANVGGTIPVFTATFNGTSMTLLDTAFVANNSSHAGWVFALASPGSVTANIVITPDTTRSMAAGAFNVSGGPANAAIGPFRGTGMFATDPRTLIQYNVPAFSANSLAIAITTSVRASNVFTPTAGQTVLWSEDSIGGTNLRSAAASKSGGAVTPISWTNSGIGENTTYGFWIPDGSAAVAGGSWQLWIDDDVSVNLGTASTTQFAPFPSRLAGVANSSGNSPTVGLSHPILCNGTIRSLSLRLATAPGVGKSRTFTILRNGQPTALTLTISGASTVGTITANAVIYAYDELCLQCDAASTPAASVFDVFAEFETAEDGAAIYGGEEEFGPLSLGQEVFNGLLYQYSASWSTTLAQRENVVAVAGTLTEYFVRYQTDLNTGEQDFYIYKNGVKQDGTGGTVDTKIALTGTVSQTGSSANNGYDFKSSQNKKLSLHFNAGDTVYVSSKEIATPGTFPHLRIHTCTKFISDTPGQFNVGGGAQATAFSQNSTVYSVLVSDNDSNSATETTKNLRIGTLSKLSYVTALWMKLGTPPGTSKSYVFTVRQNAASPGGGPSLTISGAGTTGSSVATFALASGDLLDLQSVPGGSLPATTLGSWALGMAVSTPAVITRPATNIHSFSARLNGTIFPTGTALTGHFVWDTVSPPVANVTSNQSMGSGFAAVPYHQDISGLTAGTRYYFRAVDNDGSTDTFGAILSFVSLDEATFADGQVSHPLTWIELTRRDATQKTYAEVDLNDPSTYYGGYKAPYVLQWMKVTRGTSDRTGQIEHLAFGATLSDVTREFRGLLADATNRYLTNRPLIERMIDDEERRALGLPRLVANGFVGDYAPQPDLKFDITGTDWLKKKFSRQAKAQFAWQPRITLADFPNCPPDTVGKAAPVIYGPVADDLVSGGSGTGGPVLIPIGTGVPGGYYPYGLGIGDPEMGGPGAGVGPDGPHRSFEVLPGTAPTSPVGTAIAGGSLPQTRNDSWSFNVTAIHSGVESDPSPITDVPLDWFGGERTVRAAWTAASGGANGGYNVYFTNNPYGVVTKMSTYFAPFIVSSDYVVVVHVASGVTTVDFTALSDGTPYGTEKIYLYTVSAIKGGVESAPSGIILGMSHPYVRPLHIRWLPYTGFSGTPDNYLVRRAAYTGVGVTPTFDVVFTLPNTGATGAQTIDGVTQYEFFDDFTASPTGITSSTTGTALPPPGGIVKPIYVGPLTVGAVTADAFLVARHAMADPAIRSAYTKAVKIDASQYGVTIWAPGQSGWPGANQYVTINSQRFTIVLATGAIAQGAKDGSAPLTVNVSGIEDVGDGTGVAIVRLAQQVKHFCVNYLAPDPATAGDWLVDSPNFVAIADLPLVDTDSFDAVDTATEDRIATDGYQGAGVIGADGQDVSAEDVLARFAVSGDFEPFFNRKGQLALTIEPVSAPADLTTLDDIISIVAGSFQITDEVTTEFFNVIPYVHTQDVSGRTQGGWLSIALGEVQVEDATSVTNYDQEISDQELQMYFGWALFPKGAATIADVLQRRLARYKHPLRKATIGVPLSGTQLDIGDVFQATHLEGIGSSGWVGRKVRIVRHELDPNANTVMLEVYDVEPLLT